MPSISLFRPRLTPIVLLASLLAVGCSGAGESTSPDPTKLSRFGEYDGYSETLYDEWVRESVYVPMRDGVRLAVDIVRPAVDGVAVDVPYPVIWTHSRYHRNPEGQRRRRLGEAGDPAQGSLQNVASYVDGSEALSRLVRHGYVVAAVAVRGSGASFGRYEGLFSPAETADARDVMDWMTEQPWCDGNLGMWGGSYLGITQYMAASTQHPALKAIFPVVAAFDMYDLIYNGGIYRDDMMEHWGELTLDLDVNVFATPVDADPDGALRDAAIAEHADNWQVREEYRAARFRDHSTESFSWRRHNPSTYLDEFAGSGVAAYHWGGWYDIFAMDEALWFANWQGPQKMGMGAWSHAFLPPGLAEERSRLEAIEQHRWFDYWLKGIDNGIMDEPAVTWYQMAGARKGAFSEKNEWREAASWPPPQARQVRLYLASDGKLATQAPTAATSSTSWNHDPARPTPTVGGPNLTLPLGPKDQREIGVRDDYLRFVSEPLAEDVVVAGKIDLEMWAASNALDTDFMVKLVDVYPDGYEALIIDTALRARYRCGRRVEDVCMLTPGEPTRMDVDLWYTANTFEKGHRIAVHVTSSNYPRFEINPNTGEAPGEESQPPRVAGNTVFHDAERPTALVLSVID